jgi:hypothetical protein
MPYIYEDTSRRAGHAATKYWKVDMKTTKMCASSAFPVMYKLGITTKPARM